MERRAGDGGKDLRGLREDREDRKEAGRTGGDREVGREELIGQRSQCALWETRSVSHRH